MQVNDYLYKNFEMMFPYIAERVVDIRKGMALELVMTLKDGTRMSYYDPEQTIRKLPGDGSDMTYEEFAMEFGIRLARMMKIKCVSQLELSNATWVTQSSISNYINGKKLPELYTIYKIAKYLDCEVDDFIYRY